MSPELVEGAFFSTGKRKDLEEYIASCTDAHYGQFVKVGSGSLSTALPVVAERVAIPEVAGKAWQGGPLAHLEDLRLPEVAWKRKKPLCCGSFGKPTWLVLSLKPNYLGIFRGSFD